MVEWNHRQEDSAQGTSPDGEYRWLHTKPLDAVIRSVLTPYRPGACHGHFRHHRVKTHSTGNLS